MCATGPRTCRDRTSEVKSGDRFRRTDGEKHYIRGRDHLILKY
jgi:hypothetical protein